MAFCVVTVRVALFTVRVDVPVLEANWSSPAKLTPNAPTYVPALMGMPPWTRLTFGSVATPEALVSAVPTTRPLTEKVIVRFAIAAPFRVRFNVVVRVVVPKYPPVELATTKLVAEGGAETVTLELAELLAGIGSTAEELLTEAVLLIVSRFRSVLTVEVTMVAVPD